MNILFVCLGNICRSPLAEGIMRKKIRESGLEDRVSVRSVGFEPFHRGDPADSRAIRAAQELGIDLSGHRATLFTADDFDRYDRIWVMDHHNYRDVIQKARSQADKEKVDFLMNVIHPGQNKVVPDPWYGDMNDFRETCRLLDRATEELIRRITRHNIT